MEPIMRAFNICLLTIAWLSVALPNSFADEPARGKDAVRQMRLEMLQSFLHEFEMEIAGKEPKVLRPSDQPILRWSNPVREYVNDGVTYLFLDGKRPRAVATVRATSTESSLESGQLWHEFVSLSDRPLSCSRDERVVWSPKAAVVANKLLVDAAHPEAGPARRLTQMRRLARSFEAIYYKMDTPYSLRLLAQPLYRYEDESARVLDGALFAFAEGNDPEVLLLLEAVAGGEDESPTWRYTVARMTSYRVTVQQGKREIFAADPYWSNPRERDDPYVEAKDGPFRLQE
jgi:hypothetical protein